MKRAGFSLIEIFIAIALTAIISTIIVSILGTTMRSTKAINSALDSTWKTAITYERLYIDIAGMCVVPFSSAEKEPKPEKPVDENKAEKSEEKVPDNKPIEKKEQAQIPPLIVETGPAGISRMVIVTNNPLRVYGGNIPLLMSVEYTLVPDATDKNLYKLQRRQEPIITQIEGKKEPYYTLLQGVKSLQCTVHYRLITNKEKKASARQGTTSKWPIKAAGDDEIGQLPTRLTLIVKFLDELEDEHEFMIDVPVLTAFADPNVRPVQKKEDQSRKGALKELLGQIKPTQVAQIPAQQGTKR